MEGEAVEKVGECRKGVSGEREGEMREERERGEWTESESGGRDCGEST